MQPNTSRCPGKMVGESMSVLWVTTPTRVHPLQKQSLTHKATKGPSSKTGYCGFTLKRATDAPHTYGTRRLKSNTGCQLHILEVA